MDQAHGLQVIFYLIGRIASPLEPMLSHANFFMNLIKKFESLDFKNWFIVSFRALGIMKGLLIFTKFS